MMSGLLFRVVLLVSLCGLILVSSGCVRRKATITSTPSEALVWVNSQEVGRTPLVFEFTYDGTYDIRLIHDDCVALSTSASTDPPVWDLPGIDFFAEIMPVEFTREVTWHFDLETSSLDPQKRLEAARAMRAKLEAPEPKWISSRVESESSSNTTDPISPIGSPSLPPDTPAEVPEVTPTELYPLGGTPQAGD
jgi:hypothetical protein